MKILQNEITGTQISFSTNFGDKLSFIVSFLLTIFMVPNARGWNEITCHSPMGTKKLLFFVTNLTMQLSYIRFSLLTLVAAASVAFSFVRPATYIFIAPTCTTTII
jgi:hypothetical protein